MAKRIFWFACMMLVFGVGLLIGTEAGCKKVKSGYRFVGFPQSFADLADEVKPAVVNISTTSTVRLPGSPFRHFFGPEDQGPFGDFFNRFFGREPDQELKKQSLGSGFIIDKDGFIITNNHVVEGAQEIKVKLAAGKEYRARVIGRDPKTDLALIKISSPFKDLPTLSLGNSDSMRVGDWVVAIGNPFGLEETVTQGIISATGRVIGSGPYDNFLQTDAPINPGNSGGPLVNLKGEVVGINTAIIASGQGIGFAVPSNMAKSIISQIQKKGKVVRGWIGVSVQAITPELAQSLGLSDSRGALVGTVVPGGPAERAGIRTGDVLTSFSGKEIKKMSDLPIMVAESPVGSTAPVKVIREGKTMDLTVTVAEMPEEKATAPLPASADLGLSLEDMTPAIQRELKTREKTGVVVTNVAPGSPAEDAGLQPGDIIKEVNRTRIANMKDYASALSKAGKAKKLLFLVKRGEQTFFVSISIS